MRILVTGSSGYIGSLLVPTLQSRGHDVVGLDRAEPGGAQPDSFIHTDLLAPGGLDGAFDGVDLVMHLAAARVDWGLPDEGFFRDNLHATKALLDAGTAAGITNWFFYSTVGVMRASREPLDELTPNEPIIAYGKSKSEAEKLFAGFAEANREAKVTMLRPSAVFGPGNPSNTNIYRLIDAVYKRRFVMVGNGDALKTTSYHDNLIAATLYLMDRMTAGVETYIYVDQPVLSTGELVSLIARELGLPEPSLSLPLWIASPISKVADVAAAVTGRDLPITSARIEKFCRSTNFSPAKLLNAGFVPPVSVEDALKATVEWYRREVAA